ncbi:hypothetical protein KEM56_004939 [Ascosphaera pollenicola]|nr:hypothetical protein KEM56_004939 [Ascosphaera pollenicola]
MDIDAAAHQSPYYLLPYHVARLLAGARAFGWTRAVEALSDGYGAARWGSKNASLTGLEKLVRALDEKCQQESQSPQQQQQQSQPEQTPGAGEGGGGSNVDGESGAGSQPLRVRILLSSTGRIDVQTNPLPTKVNEHIFFLNPPAAIPSMSAYSPAQPQPPFTFASLRQLHPHITPWEVRLDTQSVTPSLFTRHKSTERGEYTASRRRVGITGPNGMEVLLWNHNGEIMEGSVCSVYFRRPVAQHNQQHPNHSDHHHHTSQPQQQQQQQQQGDTIMGGTDLPGTNGSGLPDNSSSNLSLNVPMSAPQEQDDHSPMPIPPSTMASHVSAPSFTARDLWVTPPLSSGCNASTTRAYALARGMCREESVKADSIVDGEEIWLSNGLRGFIPGIIKIRLAEDNEEQTLEYFSGPPGYRLSWPDKDPSFSGITDEDLEDLKRFEKPLSENVLTFMLSYLTKWYEVKGSREFSDIPLLHQASRWLYYQYDWELKQKEIGPMPDLTSKKYFILPMEYPANRGYQNLAVIADGMAAVAAITKRWSS